MREPRYDVEFSNELLDQIWAVRYDPIAVVTERELAETLCRADCRCFYSEEEGEFAVWRTVRIAQFFDVEHAKEYAGIKNGAIPVRERSQPVDPVQAPVAAKPVVEEPLDFNEVWNKVASGGRLVP